MASPSQNPSRTVVDLPPYLTYSPDYQIVVCSEHNLALSTDTLKKHLSRNYTLKLSLRRPIITRLVNLGLTTSLATIGRLADSI